MTDIEQRLQRAGAAWRADQPDAPAPAQRPARRSRWLPALAAAAVVALALGATAVTRGLGPEPAPRTSAAGAEGSWEPMAASPLAGRLGPVMAGWGDKVVVVGGRIEPPCPPNAGCVRSLRETQRDGALYDVPSDSWEPLPEAPLPLDATSSAVLDDVLYLWMREGTVLALDLVARAWSTLPTPPDVVSEFLRLEAAGDRLIAYYGEVGRADALDLAWLPAEQRWEQLPTAPYAPTHDRVMVWTGDNLVLITAAAAPASQDEQTGPPFMRAAVLENGAWRELPEQEVVIFGSTDWSWTGDRVVSASTASADGGATNGFGRAYPSGGYLDPATGRWSELPATPDGHERASGAPRAAGGRFVANGEGLVLDAELERWIVLPDQPDGADQDASSAWAAGRLVVWGGAAGVPPAPDPGEPRLLGSGAVFIPPSR